MCDQVQQECEETFFFGKQRAMQVESSSPKWPSTAPYSRPVGTATQGSGWAEVVSPASPVYWAERSGVFIGNAL